MGPGFRRDDGLGSSAQHPDFFALDQLEIDLGAEARSGRRMDKAVAIDRDILRQSVFLHRVGQQHLEELGVADRHDDMQIGEIVQ